MKLAIKHRKRGRPLLSFRLLIYLCYIPVESVFAFVLNRLLFIYIPLGKKYGQYWSLKLKILAIQKGVNKIQIVDKSGNVTKTIYSRGL